MKHSLYLGLCLVILGCKTTADQASALRAGPDEDGTAALTQTLNDLAGFGQKRAGTDGALKAAAYLQERMTTLGLGGVRLEPFHFPMWTSDLGASSFEVEIDGQRTAVPFDLFYGSGAVADLNGEPVAAGTGRPEAFKNLNVQNKMVLVHRDDSYNRSDQLGNVESNGGAAMIYVSAAPDNAVQVGTVKTGGGVLEKIPAITIGQDDGKRIDDALAAHKRVVFHLTAAASVSDAAHPGLGQNVVGVVEGQDPSRQVIIGAHYDTWYVGSVDNSVGVAGVLELARRRAHGPKPRNTLVFVCYDGEEIGLYGGYHYLRKHYYERRDPILGILNLEMPVALTEAASETVKQQGFGDWGPSTWGIDRTDMPALQTALATAKLDEVYPTKNWWTLADTMKSTGSIATDIMGHYLSGLPIISTDVGSPFYHTPRDTVETVDVPKLAKALDHFDAMLDVWMKTDASGLDAKKDPFLWTLTSVVARADSGLDVTLKASTAAGKPAPAAAFDGGLNVDDFFQVDEQTAAGDASGAATLHFGADKIAMGAGERYVDVTVADADGVVHGEVIVPLD